MTGPKVACRDCGRKLPIELLTRVSGSYGSICRRCLTALKRDDGYGT